MTDRMDSSYEIWIDKYQAKNLDNVVGQDVIVKKLKILSKLKNIPHMIVSGNSGIGKSLAIKCFIKKINASKILDINITEDIRKINIIKSKIYNFVEQKLDRKIILIDDCDILNIQTQFLIKSIMEKSKPNLTIIMICNQLENLIETIQSRSIVLKFKKIKDEDISIFLNTICDGENIKLSKEVIDTVIVCSCGDMRKAVNCLQTICITYDDHKSLTKEDVFNVLDIPQPKMIAAIINDGCYKSMIDKINKILKLGYSSNDIIVSFFNVVKNMPLDVETKVRYIDKITFTELNINDGLDSKLQLYNLLRHFCK